MSNSRIARAPHVQTIWFWYFRPQSLCHQSIQRSSKQVHIPQGYFLQKSALMIILCLFVLFYIIDFSFHLAAAFRAIDCSAWNIGLVGNRFAASWADTCAFLIKSDLFAMHLESMRPWHSCSNFGIRQALKSSLESGFVSRNFFLCDHYFILSSVKTDTTNRFLRNGMRDWIQLSNFSPDR